jgi:hypothetical protein
MSCDIISQKVNVLKLFKMCLEEVVHMKQESKVKVKECNRRAEQYRKAKYYEDHALDLVNGFEFDVALLRVLAEVSSGVTFGNFFGLGLDNKMIILHLII